MCFEQLSHNTKLVQLNNFKWLVNSLETDPIFFQGIRSSVVTSKTWVQILVMTLIPLSRVFNHNYFALCSISQAS